MTWSVLKEKVHHFIAEDHLAEVFKLLKENLDSEGEYYPVFLTINANYSNFIKSKMLGTIKPDAIPQASGMIRAKIFELLTILGDDDLKSIPVEEKSPLNIEEKILVFEAPTLFFKESLRLDGASWVLRSLGYTNLRCQDFGEAIPAEDDIAFVILDYSDLSVEKYNAMTVFNEKEYRQRDLKRKLEIGRRNTIVEQYLKDSNHVFLYFGGWSEMVKNNSSRMLAANSPLSLHSRAKEILDFLERFNSIQRPGLF